MHSAGMDMKIEVNDTTFNNEFESPIAPCPESRSFNVPGE
jgi:hypothetical protein